ncbi:MAG: RNA chaperone Hfq [Lactobacillus sp.]|jgi:host factor-I protein|nr:RNA chaperone Hfq [Lactobacillus sp.]
MTTDKMTTHDKFLSEIQGNKMPVTIFLINGVKLQGIIVNFDDTSVLLKRDGHTQLVYKQAISTIMPNSAVEVEEGDKE